MRKFVFSVIFLISTLVNQYVSAVEVVHDFVITSEKNHQRFDLELGVFGYNETLLESEILLKNDTAKALKIKKVQGECSCFKSSTMRADSVIQPGEDATFHLRFDPSKNTSSPKFKTRIVIQFEGGKILELQASGDFSEEFDLYTIPSVISAQNENSEFMVYTHVKASFDIPQPEFASMDGVNIKCSKPSKDNIVLGNMRLVCKCKAEFSDSMAKDRTSEKILKLNIPQHALSGKIVIK